MLKLLVKNFVAKWPARKIKQRVEPEVPDEAILRAHRLRVWDELLIVLPALRWKKHPLIDYLMYEYSNVELGCCGVDLIRFVENETAELEHRAKTALWFIPPNYDARYAILGFLYVDGAITRETFESIMNEYEWDKNEGLDEVFSRHCLVPQEHIKNLINIKNAEGAILG